MAQCIICGEIAEKPAFQAYDRLYGVPGTYDYARCPGCKLLYLMTPVDREEVCKLYPSSYAPHSEGEVAHVVNELNPQEKTVKGGLSRWLSRRSFTKIIREHVINRLKGTRIKPDVYHRLTGSSRVLDVGCGSGAFLHQLQTETGCHVTGIDISAQAVRTAREAFGLEIDRGRIEEVGYPEASFDLITAWWFLEHVPDPKVVLREINKLLKDDGDLIIGVPNSNSINASVFRDRWYHLDCPRHFHLWTPDTFGKLLALHGFNVTRVVYDQTPWGLLGSLQYLFFDNNYDSRYKNVIRRNSILFLLCLPWTIAVGLLGRADIMVFYCRKT